MTERAMALSLQLARAMGLLRRERRLAGLGDDGDFADLEAALCSLGNKMRTQAKFSSLAVVEAHDGDVLAYRLDEVAANLRVTRRTVEKMIASGELPVVKVRGATRVPHNGLVEWISDSTSFRDPLTDQESA